MTVPVSGEDQPDPRLEAAARTLHEIYGLFSGAAVRARTILAATDAADRTAGIRRIKPDPQLTEDSHRVSDELYAAVAQLGDGDELRSDELATLLVRAAETLGRHRA